ncbi:MAG: hypothetical protein KBD31_00610 [Proteobacteria bacterium]|nr:hypothetical protein [Pseudomonadota bacterium]
MINPLVYKLLEDVSPHLVLWIFLFYILSCVRIILNKKYPEKIKGYGSVISELPGLPLVFMHTVAFIEAYKLNDWVSLFLFSWWGPGFFIFAAVYLYSKIFHKKINWAPFGLITSYACKIDYVIFMAIYWYFGFYTIMFAFSAWIICDQINLAYFVGTGDRTRRTFEDFWILRVMYPGFLFLPFISFNATDLWFFQLFGVLLFITWFFALYTLYKRGLFFTRYTDPDYLRNIVYLSKRYKKNDQ